MGNDQPLFAHLLMVEALDKVLEDLLNVAHNFKQAVKEAKMSLKDDLASNINESTQIIGQ